MYTITRKLAMVCLAVVFSVLVYGCGGGGSEQASTDTGGTDTPTPTDMVMPHQVTTDMVSDGLTITPGTFTIQSGDTAVVGDVIYTCPPDGQSCVVTVADDSITSVGGAATAMNSEAGNAKAADLEMLAMLLAVMNDVDATTVTMLAGLVIKPGEYEIQPGESEDAYDATFTCPPRWGSVCGNSG